MTMKWLLAFCLCVYLSISASYGQSDFFHRLSNAAMELTENRVVYDPSYFTIAYPGGDVPADRGVCTDVVIRAYRALGDVCPI
jgi:uncharacterized protein YijF (DUF1287 family)